MTNRVDDAGNARVSMRVDEIRIDTPPETPAEAVRAMEETMAAIKRVRGTQVMTDRGILVDSKIEVEGDEAVPPLVTTMLDAIRQSLQQSAVSFPREPIGVGGRWRTVTNFDSHGAKAQIESTYELNDLTAEGIMLDVGIVVRSVEPRDFDVPGLPPGTSARLESVAGTGTARTRLEFDMPMARLHSVTSKTVMVMTVGADGQTQRIEQITNLEDNMSSERIEATAAAPR